MRTDLRLAARRRLAYLRDAAIDIVDAVAGRRGAMIPPRRLRGFVGDGSFEASGREFLDHFVSLGVLRPDDAVLDVGCGIGRMAIPLTGYLSPEGRYEGLDVVPRAIAWCRRAITPRYPNFRFRMADVHNAEYRPQGTVPAEAYRFPFDDATFDFVILTSVCTHLLPGAVARYVAETGRVLRPGGRCLVTFFLLPDGAVPPDGALIDFRHAGPGYRTTDPVVPERAVAYAEADVRRWLGEAGLRVVEPMHRGWWAGGASGRSFQDIVVAERPGR